MEYIIAKHGNGRLALTSDHPDFAQYLYWLYFDNGTFQPSMGRNMILRRLNLAEDNLVLCAMADRMKRALNLVESRLGDVHYFSGSEFTAADIIMVFSLTTMRLFLPLDISPYPNILGYLQRIGARQAYQTAMKKCDPDMVPLLT